MTDQHDKPARKTGIAHVFAAASYSVGGLRRLFAEAAFRHELLAIVAVFLLFAATAAPGWAYAGFAILALVTIAFEAINTAIEELVDHASPGWSLFAKHAKDLGSLSVMCLLLANAIFVALVVFGG